MDWRSYRRALSYFRPDARLIALQLGLIGLATFAGLLVIWPMAVLVDCVFGGATPDDWIHRWFLAPLPPDMFGRIVGLALIALGLRLVHDLLWTAQTIISNRINYNGLLRIRCDLYRKFQSLSLAYHQSRPQGDAIYRLSSDTYGCQQILGVFVGATIACVTLVAMAAMLLTRSVPLTLLAFSVAPALILINIVYSPRLRQRVLECKQFDTLFTTTVQRSMSSIALVQALGRETSEYCHFRNTTRRSIGSWWRLYWQQMAYNLLSGGTLAVGAAAVFGYGGYLVYQDQFLNPTHDGMTVGGLLIFTTYLGGLWGPLCTLTGIPGSLQGGVAGAKRVFEVLDQQPAIADAPDALPLPRRPRVVSLEGLSFAYRPARTVVRDVTLTIVPGQMIGFVGPSGTGKSTLLSLLLRFYDPTAGAIRFDGHDARDVKVKDLRAHFAVVPQESMLLAATIEENIAYGRPSATPDDLRAAAELAGAASFITDLPDGYETLVSEGGQNLSGGQRQRIAIARALLAEAPVLVLDEPTSGLDPQSEQLITRTLRSLKGHRTIIVVSHRLSTVADCDEIFVMDDGRIVERGTHEALLTADGLYRSMAGHQLGFRESTGKPWQEPRTDADGEQFMPAQCA